MSRKNRSAPIERYLAQGEGNPLASPAENRRQLLTNMYLRLLIELSANRFEWKGLPPEVDVRYLELTILRNGVSMFYFEPEFEKFMTRPASPRGQNNMSDEPTSFSLTLAPGGIGKRVIRKGQGVPVWGSYLRIPDTDTITVFATRLADIDMTLEINTRQARRTRIITAPKNQRLSYQNISNQIDEGEAVIGVNPGFDPEAIQAIDMGINPDNIEKLHIARGRIWNQAMSLLGINNANQDKKERLVADEVAANDEQVDAMKAVHLNARKRAAAEINSLYDGSEAKALQNFGYRGDPLNVSVDYVTAAPAEAPAVPAFSFDNEDTE